MAQATYQSTYQDAYARKWAEIDANNLRGSIVHPSFYGLQTTKLNNISRTPVYTAKFKKPIF